MKIGLLQVELALAGCDSLKDKRAILQALKHRLRSKLNVSVAEVGDHDVWRRAQFALVAIGNAPDSVERIFRDALAVFESRPDAVVHDYHIEML